MNVPVLLVSHGRLGQQLLETLHEVMGDLPLRIEVLEIRQVHDTEPLVRMGERLVEKLDGGDGVLLLTDAYGSTPGNIASRIAAAAPSRVVAGLNLPMLLKICNYPQLPLADLAAAAVDGGRRGILDSGSGQT